MSDPIVDEIRSTRERLAMAAGGDNHAIAQATRERQRLSGMPAVTRPARKPQSLIDSLPSSSEPGVSPLGTPAPTTG